MKKLYGVLAGISFVVLLGVVGGVEHNTISLGIGFVAMSVGIIAFALFTWLAGGFNADSYNDR